MIKYKQDFILNKYDTIEEGFIGGFGGGAGGGKYGSSGGIGFGGGVGGGHYGTITEEEHESRGDQNKGGFGGGVGGGQYGDISEDTIGGGGSNIGKNYMNAITNYKRNNIVNTYNEDDDDETVTYEPIEYFIMKENYNIKQVSCLVPFLIFSFVVLLVIIICSLYYSKK